MAVALIHFVFNYGDLIRWLKGEYTNAHRDWSTVSDAMNAVWSINPQKGTRALILITLFKPALMVSLSQAQMDVHLSQ